jgi:hypothetical protein
MFKRLKKLMKKGIVNVVTGLIVVVVTIMIGAIILGQLYGVTSGLGLSGIANTTITNLFNQTWSAFALFVIVPIIVVAGVLIGLLGGWGRGRR